MRISLIYGTKIRIFLNYQTNPPGTSKIDLKIIELGPKIIKIWSKCQFWTFSKIVKHQFFKNDIKNWKLFLIKIKTHHILWWPKVHQLSVYTEYTLSALNTVKNDDFRVIFAFLLEHLSENLKFTFSDWLLTFKIPLIDDFRDI